ncbi:MAG: phosphorylase kinase [Cyanothece sp. SIO1E1]|nr:phosphorylase kinase [Cyanothece sp. SIO1E1]
MLIVHNERILDLLKSSYTLEDIQKIVAFLAGQHTFDFPTLATGLFPAAILDGDTAYTGYANVWVRDNIHIAHAHYVLGRVDAARTNAQALMTYFQKYKWRFERIIDAEADPQHPMNRPHIRFDGNNLKELVQTWPHAQNDALGYFLWFYCTLIGDHCINPTPVDVETLALFPLYFQAIQYWQDQDSGHWEETRKIEASSIGTVIAGLKSLKQLYKEPAFVCHRCQYQAQIVTPQLLDDLIVQGTTALEQILPAECIQPDLAQNRRYDAALLFLIYPLQIISDQIADQILADVLNNLKRGHGICRYLGDSYWFADYKQTLAQEKRTADFSNNMTTRDACLQAGEEAQWCIFDPIVSIIFGIKFQQTHQQQYLHAQIQHLNRSLGQLTGTESEFGAFKCPELYYLEAGKYVPSDATPLLWTQANVAIALKMMEQSLAIDHQ